MRGHHIGGLRVIHGAGVREVSGWLTGGAIGAGGGDEPSWRPSSPKPSHLPFAHLPVGGAAGGRHCGRRLGKYKIKSLWAPGVLQAAS